MKVDAIYRLSKYTLKKYLHNEWWIREYGLNDLCLLANGGSNLCEQVHQALFGFGRVSIRIWQCIPAQ